MYVSQRRLSLDFPSSPDVRLVAAWGDSQHSRQNDVRLRQTDCS